MLPETHLNVLIPCFTQNLKSYNKEYLEYFTTIQHFQFFCLCYYYSIFFCVIYLNNYFSNLNMHSKKPDF